MPIDTRSWPRRMGVSHGDNILLFADLTRIAWNVRKGGGGLNVQEFLDAFLDAVGGKGTVVIPTFNYDLRSGESFDIRRTPTISGSLGQAALAHPRFRRTGNPLHSFAVAGALVEEFLAADEVESFGDGSPFDLLHRHAFRNIAIDMPLGPAFTYVHRLEHLLKVPYRKDRRLRISYTGYDGTTRERTFHVYAKRPGHVNDLKDLELPLKQADALREQVIDGSKYLVLDLRKAHEVVARDIIANNARGIVRFRWTWWLRDVLRPVLKKRSPSRSAQMILRNAADPR